MSNFLKELRYYVKEKEASYFKNKVEQIKNEIKTKALKGESSLWVRFYWDDGDYSPILEYFSSQGVEAQCPTGPDDGEFTDFLFVWSI